MRVNVNFDKIMKELWQHLSYKNAIVLKLKLEGKSHVEIARALGMKLRAVNGAWGGERLDDSGVMHHLKRCKKALGVETDIELALLCYERGYVTIEEEGAPPTAR